MQIGNLNRASRLNRACQLKLSVHPIPNGNVGKITTECDFHPAEAREACRFRRTKEK
jgi:hypothetical protein